MKIPETHRLYRIANDKKALSVSYSQIKTFQKCPLKWYYSYIEGIREEKKTENTEFGFLMHEVLEAFFNSGCAYDAKGLSDLYNFYAANRMINWKSIESGLEYTKCAVNFLGWISKIFERDGNGKVIRPYNSLSDVEKLIRGGKSNQEERFDLPYRLPVQVSINGEAWDNVMLGGSIDCHKMFGKEEKEHFLIDWKTNSKPFSKEEMEGDLQFPIYSMYILRKYGKLPRACTYVYIKTNSSDTVMMDMEKVKKASRAISGVLSEMYDFGNKRVSRIALYKKKASGYYGYSEAELKEPVTPNMKPCPSKLCYWCDFSKHKKGVCPYSSGWTPEEEEKQNGQD